MGWRVRAEQTKKGETLISERQDGLQFPLRPYNHLYRVRNGIVSNGRADFPG
jgi:hypothetical protein